MTLREEIEELRSRLETIDADYSAIARDFESAVMEIERMKEESKKAYLEGSQSCDDLISFYVTKIASLEEKLKVSNDSAIK